MTAATATQPPLFAMTPVEPDEVPPGRYTVAGRTYRVRRGKLGGLTVRTVQARGSEQSLLGQRARQALVDIGADLAAAAEAYGTATGRCAMCNRLLTKPVSVTRGIGPDCLANLTRA
jgi:hypothetical protein